MLGQDRLVEGAPLGARERERAQRGAVEGRPARDQVGLAGVPAQLPVAQRELDRRLDRLRAGRVEEAPRVGQRRDAAQLLGQLQHRPVAEREAVREGELGDLPLHDLDEARMAVPERHHHGAAAGIDVAAAVLVDDARAARAGGDLEQRAGRGGQREVGAAGHAIRTVARLSPRGAHRSCVFPRAQVRAEVEARLAGDTGRRVLELALHTVLGLRHVDARVGLVAARVARGCRGVVGQRAADASTSTFATNESVFEPVRLPTSQQARPLTIVALPRET